MTIARKLMKAVLFIGLFLLSIRYIHMYPVPMTETQLVVWYSISDRLGIRDPEDLYISVMLILELLATVAAYVLILKSWRFLRRPHSTD